MRVLDQMAEIIHRLYDPVPAENPIADIVVAFLIVGHLILLHHDLIFCSHQIIRMDDSAEAVPGVFAQILYARAVKHFCDRLTDIKKLLVPVGLIDEEPSRHSSRKFVDSEHELVGICRLHILVREAVPRLALRLGLNQRPVRLDAEISRVRPHLRIHRDADRERDREVKAADRIRPPDRGNKDIEQDPYLCLIRIPVKDREFVAVQAENDPLTAKSALDLSCTYCEDALSLFSSPSVSDPSEVIALKNDQSTGRSLLGLHIRPYLFQPRLPGKKACDLIPLFISGSACRKCTLCKFIHDDTSCTRKGSFKTLWTCCIYQSVSSIAAILLLKRS